MLTPVAIRNKINLNKVLSTTKKAESVIVDHNRKMVGTFTLSGTPFRSR